MNALPTSRILVDQAQKCRFPVTVKRMHDQHLMTNNNNKNELLYSAVGLRDPETLEL